VAYLAGNIHVRQELHFDADDAGPLAGLAASPFHVEREPAGAIAAHPGFRQRGVQRADRAKHVRVRRRVGARRAPDRRLVDIDDLVNVLRAIDRFVCPGLRRCSVQDVCQPLVNDLHEERALARAGYPGERHKRPQRHGHGEVLQVVGAGSLDQQVFAIARPARRRDRHLGPATQVLARRRGVARQEFLQAALEHYLAAVLARAGAEIDDVIRGADRRLVVLHDDHAVPQIPQLNEGVNKPAVIPLMEPDRGLVQDVQHAHQFGPNLRSEADALRLPARKRRRSPRQRQIVQPDVRQEAETRQHLLKDRLSDESLPRR